jgi:hypothetical protein
MLAVAIRSLVVFLLVLVGLTAFGLPWWGALIGAGCAWFPITNQLSIIITNIRRPLEPYFQPSPPNARLPSLLEDLAVASSWGEDQQKQSDEIVSIAEGDFGVSALFGADQLRTMLTEGEPKKTISSYAFALIFLWKIARSEWTIPTIRKELLAIAADLRKVEVRSELAQV